MRDRVLQKLKQNKAFTLMETLVVVGIMVILMGISMVGLTNYTTTLKMTELDSYAKTIYLEAQNQLIAEKVEGGLPKLTEKFESGRWNNRLITAPADYPNATTDTDWKNLFYVGKKDNTYCSYIIWEDSFINGESGDYLIEFDPKTGVVYGVFYWESEGKDYASISSMEDRSLEARTKARIGYYGGFQSDLLGDSKLIDQKVEIINEDELYLKITLPKTDDVIEALNQSDPLTGPYLEMRYEISNASNADSMDVWGADIDRQALLQKIKTDNLELVEQIRSYEIYILLDSMQSGHSIKDLTESMVDENGNTVYPKLNFDKPLNVTVYTSIQGNPEIAPEDTTVTFNGLYANTTDEYLYSTDSEKDELSKILKENTNQILTENGSEGKIFHVVDVKNLRHMRNLDLLNSSDTDIASDIVVRLQNKIDFSNSNCKWSFNTTETGEVEIDYLEGDATASNPLSVFSPIQNKIFTEEDYTVYVEGTNYGLERNGVLQNFIVKSDNDNVGLWASTNNVTFINIAIEDIIVDGTGHNQVGALVGNMSDGAIINSGVFLSNSYKLDGVTKYYARETADNSLYSNKMEERYDSYKVTGNENVGGLVGQMHQVRVSESYSAIKVKATANNVGGFVGQVTGNTSHKTIIDSSYASGDVYGASNVGGFVGNANYLNLGGQTNSGSIKGVYATGNVYADRVFGGMVGTSKNSNYKNCTYYGMVHADGENVMPSAVSGGGFVGASNGGNTYDAENDTCTYLYQTGQNDNVIDFDFVVAKNYAEYLDGMTQPMTAGVSYPYTRNLINAAFPFGAHWETQTHHYGNWKQQYVINNSLVYYEKYADDTYGYYCMTYMAGNQNQWLLDTLRDDKDIKEDGYALLSKYNLQYIDYDLQVGSIVESDVENNAELKKYMQSDRMYVTSDEKSLYQLSIAGDVSFYEYSSTTGMVDDNKKFTVTGLYLYRLPYELQCTERYNVENFYDRFTITQGVIADGNTREDDDIPVIENLTFIYCPHFAKTAFNPNVNDENETSLLSTLKKDNPETVSVRTARQLNALGRNPYYWNYKGGGKTRLSFQQEVDINFSTYTKKYCGKTFNLLAFDQEYSNQPIGQYNNSAYSSFANEYNGNFNKIIDYCVKSDNQYVGLFGEIYVGTDINRDGISDECLNSNGKYDGVVDDWDGDGDYNDANDLAIKKKYHQIQNVFMVVSGENDGSSDYTKYPNNPELQNNAGYIIGTFMDDLYVDGKLKVDNARSRTGVGALIGSDYTIGASDDESAQNVKAFTVYNCAAVGYNVEYHVGEYTEVAEDKGIVYHRGVIPADKQTPIGIAVGGLVGYSRANFSNCSALNDVRLVVFEDYVTETHTGIQEYVSLTKRKEYISYGDKEVVFLGGFVGSHYFGTAKYSYAGGTIDVDFGEDAQYVFRMRIGGFCPGWLDAPGLADSGSGEKVRYETVYSYAEVSDDVWAIKESADGDAANFNHLIPTVGRLIVQMKEVSTSVRTGLLNWTSYTRLKWDTTSVDGARWGVRVPGMSMYLTSVFDATDISRSEAKNYFQKDGDNGQTCREVSYFDLSDFSRILSIVKGDRGVLSESELHKADYTYTDSGEIGTGVYPFPAFTFEEVEQEDGSKVIYYNHYGDFPPAP